MYDLIKKETAIKWSQYGISATDIANRMGVPYATVCKWIRENQKANLEAKIQTEDPKGWNADRHACKTCIYGPSASDRNNGIGCNYCWHTGHFRKCDPKDCDKYVKGKKLKRENKPW